MEPRRRWPPCWRWPRLPNQWRRSGKPTGWPWRSRPWKDSRNSATKRRWSRCYRCCKAPTDRQVKSQAALGLAYAADPLVAALLFAEPAAAVLSKDELFVAAFTLGPAGEDRLALFLDDADESLRSRALVLLLLLELKAPQ